MKNNLLLVLIFCAISLFQCCKKPKEDIPDPCKGIPSSTAEFESLEDVGFMPQDSVRKWLLNKDTLIGNRQLYLYPKDTSADEYTWQIENKVYPTAKGPQKEKYFNFDYSVNGNLKISLKTKKKKGTYTCYPNDDSIKTYSRNFYLYPYDKMPFLDTWIGKYDGDNETSEVTVRIRKNSLDGYFDIDIMGFPKTCDSLYYTDGSGYAVDRTDFNTFNFRLSINSELTYVKGCTFKCCENENLKIYGRVINKDSIIIWNTLYRFIGKRKK